MSEYLEKLRSLGWAVKNPQKNRHNKRKAEDMNAACVDKDSAIYNLTKDRIASKHILQGNASDPGLKKEAEGWQRRHDKKRKDSLNRPKLERIAKKKREYKRKWKCEPV